MGFNDILKSLFGNKSDRDMKELMPIVAKVNAEWEKLKSISADELRAVAEDMKKEVREYIGEGRMRLQHSNGKWKRKGLRSKNGRKFTIV